VVGGLLFSQTLTLYVTPVFYIVMDGLQKRFGRRRGRGEKVEPPTRPEPVAAEEQVPATASLRLSDV
jgi:HAE1 family hydrophobic/amphiphilic exporter-1